MDTEELIRSALRRQAEDAPEAERTRAALPARARARRRRRTATGVGIAAVTAVILAGPAIAAIRWSAPQSDPVTVGTSPAAPTPTPAGYTMDYRPTWLPDGLVERDRSVITAGPHEGWRSRTWSADPWVPNSAASLRYVTVTAMPATVEKDIIRMVNPRPVDINGVSGTLGDTEANLFTLIRWPVDTTTVLEVTVSREVPDAVTVATRVARSVIADPTTRLTNPLTLGWLPERVADQTLIPQRTLLMSGNSSGDWQLQTWFGYAKADSVHKAATWYVSVGTYRAPLTEGQPVSVRGRTGVVVLPHNGGKFDSVTGLLEVDLDGGLILTLQAPPAGDTMDPTTPQLTVADMVRIADSVDVGALPDLAWFGQHP